MKQVLSKLGLLTLAALAVPTAASAAAPFEGRWANPKRSVIIEVAPCGPAYCGGVDHSGHLARSPAVDLHRLHDRSRDPHVVRHGRTGRRQLLRLLQARHPRRRLLLPRLLPVELRLAAQRGQGDGE